MKSKSVVSWSQGEHWERRVDLDLEENKKNKEQENDGQEEPEEEIVDEIINVE